MDTKRNDILKLIACICMVFDHWAALFHPELIWLRIPGRITFPIFAYYAAFGACHTHNAPKYLIRLLIAAIITQPIYYMLFGHMLNVIFTILYGVMCILLWENKKIWVKCLGAAALICAIPMTALDYGAYGVYSIFLFYYTGKQLPLTLTTQFLLLPLTGQFWVQYFCLLATPLIYCPWNRSVRLPRYFFYIFYPAHLALLLILFRLM